MTRLISAELLRLRESGFVDNLSTKYIGDVCWGGRFMLNICGEKREGWWGDEGMLRCGSATAPSTRHSFIGARRSRIRLHSCAVRWFNMLRHRWATSQLSEDNVDLDQLRVIEVVGLFIVVGVLFAIAWIIFFAAESR